MTENCRIGLHDYRKVKEQDDVVIWKCAHCDKTDVRPYVPPTRKPYDPYSEF